MVGRVIAHYTILEKLGEGGMGVVYRAHDEQLKRDVALKVLPERTLADEIARTRFRHEALALAKLNHQNVESVYHFGSHEGIDYLVTEYVPGKTVSEILADRALTQTETVHLAIQMASALEHAHETGVVHCDLKPGNIMVTPQSNAKLLDFGLAKTVRAPGSETTQTLTGAPGTILGTIPYMAPEQLRGGPATSLSDIYAAGAVMYEMATGRRAFPQESTAELVTAILQEHPPAPGAINRSLSGALEDIILRCLEKDPARRLQSAGQLRAALAAVSVHPGRRPAMRRLARFLPRRAVPARGRWFVGVSAVFLFAIALGVWHIFSQPALSFSPRDWVLMTDFENRTGDALFDRSLADAFAISLAQSTHANLVPPTRIAAALRRMNRKPGERIDEQLGREVCLRENVRGLITCAIDRVGGTYLLSARLVNPGSGEAVRSYLERAKTQNDVLDALGTIASKIRHDLGESLVSIRTTDKVLARVTTPSLRALQLYSDARYLWGVKGEYQVAVKLYEEALRHDQEFAMAHGALGLAYCSHIYNDRGKCKEHYDEALRLAGRVTDRERLSIQASAASSLGNPVEALGAFRALLRAYPDDDTAHYSLGTILMRAHRTEEAIEELKLAIWLAPRNASGYINLATCYSQARKPGEAVATYQKAFELEPGWVTLANLNHEYGFALVDAGFPDKARAVFELAVARPDMKAQGLRSLGLLDMHEGKYREAALRLREAIVMRRAAKNWLSEARERLFLSIVFDGWGNAREALAQLDEAQRVLKEGPSPQPWIISRIAVSYARMGAVANAERMLLQLRRQADRNRQEDSSEIHWLEGEIMLARGERDRAIETLLLADRENSTLLTTESLAHVYSLAGQASEAAASLEKLLADKCLGWEPQQSCVAAHYELARIRAAQGEKGRARDLLDRLRRMWKDADQDLPLLKRAQLLRSSLE